MTRSWLAFGVGVVLLLSPLRFLWARGGAPVWSVFSTWALLVVVGFVLSRSQR